MPILEYDYSDKDYQLVATQGDGNLLPQDYVRISVYEIGTTDIVRNNAGAPSVFYSSLSQEEFDINISPTSNKLNELLLKTVGGDENDFKIYTADDGSVYVKPNEIFNTHELPQGNYTISIDFLNQVKPHTDAVDVGNHYQWIIKEISTSRKEIRLKLENTNILNNSNIIQTVSSILNDNSDSYSFKHLVSFGITNNLPIMNYHFDSITDGKDNQSIILKLYEPVSRNIRNLTNVTLEREVLITQTTDVYYFSDVEPLRDGGGLIPDNIENWLTPNQNKSLELENYNDITSSLSNTDLQNILSSSKYAYPNLNTDFRFFENHTHYGSAKRKLENFKNKVETIQGYYSDISSSLSASGVQVTGDSNQIVQYREDLFDKIDGEISTFTPYERFLYFDGQQESTASAPGVGKNYAYSIPVSTNKGDSLSKPYVGQLNGEDSFNVVYHHSSKDIGGVSPDIPLFSNKYRIENQPFFNYDSSVYLSFLMKANNGVSLNWDNTNTYANSLPDYDEYNIQYRLPEASM